MPYIMTKCSSDNIIVNLKLIVTGRNDLTKNKNTGNERQKRMTFLLYILELGV